MRDVPRQASDRYGTRTSLLQHVRDLGNDTKWQEFYDTYWDLVFSTACRSGLAPPDAEDLTQAVFIELTSIMPRFEYDRSQGSFRGWLLRRVNWRIKDYFKRRSVLKGSSQHGSESTEPELDGVTDPEAERTLEEFWNAAWRQAVVRLALHNIQKSSKISERHFQILDLLLVRGLSPADTAQRLQIKRGLVDTVFCRIRARLEEEIDRLREQPI